MTDTLISGPRTWFERAQEAAGADVAGRFGARDPHNAMNEATRAAMQAARAADAAIKDHGALYRNELVGAADLHADFAARLDGLAKQCELARVEARMLGWLNHARTLYSLESILETCAGEVRAETQEIKP